VKRPSGGPVEEIAAAFEGKGHAPRSVPNEPDRTWRFGSRGEGELGHLQSGVEHVQSEIATSEVKMRAASLEVIDLSLSLLDALSHDDRIGRAAAGEYGGPMDLKIVPALVLVEPLGDLRLHRRRGVQRDEAHPVS
jgi:hypothetical protein